VASPHEVDRCLSWNTTRHQIRKGDHSDPRVTEQRHWCIAQVRLGELSLRRESFPSSQYRQPFLGYCFEFVEQCLAQWWLNQFEDVPFALETTDEVPEVLESRTME